MLAQRRWSLETASYESFFRWLFSDFSDCFSALVAFSVVSQICYMVTIWGGSFVSVVIPRFGGFLCSGGWWFLVAECIVGMLLSTATWLRCSPRWLFSRLWQLLHVFGASFQLQWFIHSQVDVYGARLISWDFDSLIVFRFVEIRRFQDLRFPFSKLTLT